MTKNQSACAFVGLFGFFTTPAYTGDVIETSNPETGLRTWQVEEAGFSVAGRSDLCGR